MIFFNKYRAYEQLDKIFSQHEAAEIKIYYPKRSLPQNKLLWLYCSFIGKELGYTSDEVKYIFQERFLTYEKSNHKFVKGTSGLNTKEFTDFIENIIIYCATELSIELPDPSDKQGLIELQNEFER